MTIKKKAVTKKKANKRKTTLSSKQRRFVEEYLIDTNATQAAIRAGYSKKTAQQMGSENLLKPVIAAEIQTEMDKRSERTEITADRVLEEIAKMAFANIEDFVDWTNGTITVKSSSGLTKRQTAAVSEISESVSATGGTVKIKLHDKKGSLELLGKHLKLFTEKHEHGVDDDLKALLDRLDGSSSGLPDGSTIE